MPRRISAEEAAKMGLRSSKSVASEYAESVRPTGESGAVADINARMGPTGKEEMLGEIAAAAQTGSLGSGDQLAGLLSAAKGEGYGKGQQEAEQSLDLAQKNHPVASAAGALPMMAVGGAPTAAGRMGLTGLVGSASGAFNSPGAASAGETIKDAATSGLGSMALGGLFEGATRVASPMLRRMAEGRAVRAGGAQKPDLARLANASPLEDPNQKARELGRMLLDLRRGGGPSGGLEGGKPMLGRFSSAENMAKRIGGAKRETGQALGGLKDMAQDKLESSALYEVHKRPIQLGRIEANLRKQANEALRGGQADLATALNAEADDIQKMIDARLDSGDYIGLKLPESEGIKSRLQDGLQKNYGKMQGPAIEARKATASAYRAAGDEAFEKAAGPDDAEHFKALKGRYGKLSDVARIAKSGAVSDAARMPVGLTEQNSALLMAGTGGAPVEQIAKAAAGAGVSRLVRGRGDAFMARALDDLSRPTGKAARSLAADDEDRDRIRRYLESLAE